ncbi:MAG: hypothetical protein LUE93_04390 [Bacteroides sp.]|nr:hypothetical protein [Bacteroides sp.]
MKDTFDFSLPDSQATAVEPIKPEKFDFESYQAYEQGLLARCKKFWESDSGVLVHRRMRVQEVFSYDSKDMEKSLGWQLGALWKSMAFQADVPNFLEPWYGLGTIASAFGFDYVWSEGQAPAINGHFDSVEQLLAYEAKPVEKTPIGKHTLDMIDYFLTKTQGKLPLSYSDIQSPLNIVANIVDSNQFYMDFMLNPDLIHQAFDRTAALFVDYMKIQQRMIGDALAKPGHGFASSRCFDGMGMSDDNIVMLSNDMYNEFAVPAFIKACTPFGGGPLLWRLVGKERGYSEDRWDPDGRWCLLQSNRSECQSYRWVCRYLCRYRSGTECTHRRYSGCGRGEST